MKKSDFLKILLNGAIPFIPGGAATKGAIEALVKRNDDPDDDVEEIANAIGDLVVGVLQGVEGISGKDVVNDPILVQLIENIEGDIKLYVQLVPRLKPAA